MTVVVYQFEYKTISDEMNTKVLTLLRGKLVFPLHTKVNYGTPAKNSTIVHGENTNSKIETSLQIAWDEINQHFKN